MSLTLGLVRRLSTLGHRTPWFVSPNDICQSAPAPCLVPIPDDTPKYLRALHSELSTSPYLETSSLMVTRPIMMESGELLPVLRPRGSRRKRGGTDAGLGMDMPGSGLWSWIVLAQVKEGTESRGSINRVVKVVRKTLKQLASSGDVSWTLPPLNRKQVFTDGWAMLDAGEFAVHILSRDARQKWFPF